MRDPGPGQSPGRPPVQQLGPDWVPGEDGMPFRRGARVLLFDEEDRVLLVRGHDQDQPERTWWFTVGGGIDPGESPRQAAVREVREETGLRLDPDGLLGPVAERTAVFDFLRQAVRQHELFFVARVVRPGALSHEGWTAVERSFMDEARWWHLEDLGRSGLEIFPSELVSLATGLLAGWDGAVRQLLEQRRVR